jgi:hypothetical protein
MITAGPETDFDELKARFERQKEVIEQEKERYFEAAHKLIELNGKEVIQKDALIIADLGEKVGEFNWGAENGRVTKINLENKDLPENLPSFPDGLRELGLNGATLPENLPSFPDGLQRLWLRGATLKTPDGTIVPVTEDESFMNYLREYRKRNPNTEIKGVNV